MRLRWWFFTWSCLAFAVAEAGSKPTRLLVLPVSLSGTFQPLTLAVDGKVMLKGTSAITDLDVNGEKVRAKKAKRRPFFHQTSADRLSITMFGDDSPEPMVVELPKVEITRASDSEIELGVSGDFSSVLIGGEALDVRKGTAEWKIPDSREARYVVEVKGSEGNPGRFYHLMLAEPKCELAGEASPAAIRLVSFYAGPILSYQAWNLVSSSTELGWMPRYTFDESWSASINLGGTLFKKAGGGIYGALEYELLAGYVIVAPVALDLGVGAQTWVGHGGTRVMASFNLAHISVKYLWSYLDRIFLGYSLVFDSRKVHQLKLAAVFSF